MHNFRTYLTKNKGTFGTVTEVTGVIVKVSGLKNVKPDEIVVFHSQDIGQVFSIKDGECEILTFARHSIKPGMQVVPARQEIEIPVGDGLLGNVVDALGRAFDHNKVLKNISKTSSLNTPLVGIVGRKTIKKHLETGVAMVDMLVPIGQGQRELVIGDRKTGKTNFLLQTMVAAAKQGHVCIYAAIGKKKLDIKRAEEFFIKNKVMDRIVIVASTSQDPAGIVYLTPYSAMTVAEYFRDQGIDTLLILDDLSTHAKFYREISLLGGRFPGRNSYPGDIFYIHARLLERAGNFVVGKREVSITCLPVVETLQGDLSGYIQTNIMSMTDGHIYFDSDLFSQGRRPAINPFLSVTRVGHQTQSEIKRNVSRELLSFLTLFEKMQNISHFGAELTDNTRITLETGKQVVSLFEQGLDTVIPNNLQSILFVLVVSKLVGDEDMEKIGEYKKLLASRYSSEKAYKDLVDKIITDAKTFEELEELVKKNSAKILKKTPL